MLARPVVSVGRASNIGGTLGRQTGSACIEHVFVFCYHIAYIGISNAGIAMVSAPVGRSEGGSQKASLDKSSKYLQEHLDRGETIDASVRGKWPLTQSIKGEPIDSI